MRILVVEDDKTIASGLEYSLKQEEHEIILRFSYEEGKRAIQEKYEEIDLCIFDLTLPDGSGYDLCKMIKEKSDVPVVFLTALDDEVNVVMGLDMGADDYITKPFRLREFISRIKSVYRRYSKQMDEQGKVDIHLGNVRINTLEGKVYKNNKEVFITALEYRLLLVFASHKGQVLLRDLLLEKIWDVAGQFVNDNTLTVYIKRLREKLEDDPHKPRLIKTVRGLGYKAGD